MNLGTSFGSGTIAIICASSRLGVMEEAESAIECVDPKPVENTFSDVFYPSHWGENASYNRRSYVYIYIYIYISRVCGAVRC